MTEPTMHPGGSPEQPNRSSSVAPSGPGAAGPPVHRERRSRSVGWRSKDVLRTAALIVGIYVVLKIVWAAHELFFVVFLGVLFGLAVASAVDRLEKRGIPRGVGAALVVVGFLGVVTGLGAMMAPTLRTQSRELRARLPEAKDKVEDWINNHQSGLVGLAIGGGKDSVAARPGGDSSAGTTGADTGTSPAQDSARTGSSAGKSSTSHDSAARGEVGGMEGSGTPAAKLKAKLSAGMGGATRLIRPVITSTIAAVAGILIILFLSIYIGAEPATYRKGLMHLFPQRARGRAGEVLAAVGVALRKWLVTQLIAMAVMAVVTTILLLVLKVKAAFALGLVAGLLEFIPTVGPILSSIPAIGMGFLDSPQKAVLVAVVYILIHFLESHILIPLLMRGGVNLPPALTVVTQALMALLFGFIGLMVAVPVLAAVMVSIKMLYVEDVVGDPMNVLDEDEDD